MRPNPNQTLFAYTYFRALQRCSRAACLLLVFMLASCSLIAQLFRNEWIDYSKTYFRFPVVSMPASAAPAGTNQDPGDYNRLHRIPYATLLTYGLAGTPVEHFQLWRHGKEIAIYTYPASGIMGTDGYLEFWGEGNDGIADTDLYLTSVKQPNKRWSMFTDTAQYYLTVNPAGANKRLETINHNPFTSTLTPDSFFMHTIRVSPRTARNRGYALTISGKEVRSSSFDDGEGWGESRFGNDSFAVRLGKLFSYQSGNEKITVNVSMQGASSQVVTMLVKMNDSTINTRFYRRYTPDSSSSINIPLSRIDGNDSTNIVCRMQVLSSSYRFFVSKVEMRYPRQFRFQKNTKHFVFELPSTSQGNLLKIVDFDTSGAEKVLLDLTNNKRYVAQVVEDTLWFELQPSASARRLVLTSYADAPKSIPTLTPRQFINYGLPENQGDYIIISNSRLYNDNGANRVEEYRNYRSSAAGGGYIAKVFDMDEITDQFGYGILKHPLAIRNLLRYARSNFSVQPKAALLIGRGATYDYPFNDINAANLNLVPTWGQPASDNLLAAANNNSAVPATIIGRVAAITGAEVKDYLDKVIAFEQYQNNPDSNKTWQKETLHLIGGNDQNLVTPIKGFMDNYKTIIEDTLIGARVQTFVRVNNPDTYLNNQAIQQSLYSGTGLMSYFGHSSNTSFDFNLNNPDELEVLPGRYPVFIANGCNASEFFDVNPKRYNQQSLTLSERFVLAPAKGSIAFISSTHYGIVQNLNVFTENWYKAASTSQFGRSVGDIHKQAISKTLELSAPNDFQTRLTVEEFHLHGDPVVRIHSEIESDYAIDSTQIVITPSLPKLNTDTVKANITIANPGKAIAETVRVLVKRKLPGGQVQVVKDTAIANIKNLLTFSVPMALKSNAEAGQNEIEVVLDPENKIAESIEDNNTAVLRFNIAAQGAKPLMPQDFSIVSNWPQALVANAYDPWNDTVPYRLQMDTTELFNSPILYEQDTLSAGNTIRFMPANSLIDGSVYYWRVARLINGIPGEWQQASFTYLNGADAGFNQGHYFQHKYSEFKAIDLDSASRSFKYRPKFNNLYFLHGIYNTSATEDLQFSITPNGVSNIYSACVGRSIIFNVFDSLSFIPWKNSGGQYGSGPFCAPGREYNFEFQYFPASNRKKIMDFLDAIPAGHYVTARLVLDPDPGQPGFPSGKADSSYAEYWMRDTLFYGTDNSLYHKLLKQGFKTLDQLNTRRTFSFSFRKDDTLTYKPQYVFSDGLFDIPVLSADLPMTDTTGELTSPWIGPASNWQSMHWRGLAFTEPNGVESDTVRMYVLGRKASGQVDTLLTLNKQQQDIQFVGDTAIDANTYPNLQLRLKTNDSDNATPYQLDYWRVHYVPKPEGAVTPREYFRFNTDSVGMKWKDTLYAKTDTLKFGIAFRNIGNTNFTDSISYEVILEDSMRTSTVLASGNLRPLVAGDSLHIEVADTLTDYGGNARLYVAFNRNKPGAEITLDNNFLYHSFYIVAAYPPNLKIFSGTGNWSDGSKWTPYGAPACKDRVIINGDCVIDVNNAVSDSVIIADTGRLAILSPDAFLNVGCAPDGGNKLVTVKGRLEIYNGTLHVNGGLLLVDSSHFKQAGGSIILDPNTGDSATSLSTARPADGNHYLPAAVLSFGGFNSNPDSLMRPFDEGMIEVTGGEITIVDPPYADSSYTLFFANTSSQSITLDTTNFIRFGGLQAANTDLSVGKGFVIHVRQAGGTGSLVLGNVKVSGGANASRKLVIEGEPAFVLRVKGVLQIESGSGFELKGANELKIGPEE